MATTTTNYGLTKPSGNDDADISVINANMDIIDTKMKEIEDAGGGGGGSSVEWTQVVTSGTKIAEVTIDGSKTDVYAPTNSGGGGSSLHNYSTEEQIVGTWIDGKPIYQKTLTGTSTQGIYRIDVSGLSIEHIVDYNLNEMLNVNGNDNVYGAYYGAGDDYLRLYYNDSTKEIIFASGSKWSYGDYSLTLQYTKTIG